MVFSSVTMVAVFHGTYERSLEIEGVIEGHLMELLRRSPYLILIQSRSRILEFFVGSNAFTQQNPFCLYRFYLNVDLYPRVNGFACAVLGAQVSERKRRIPRKCSPWIQFPQLLHRLLSL